MSMPRAAARSASAALRPGEVHRAIATALDAAGMDPLWVAGTVAGLRVRPRFTSLELVEYESGGSSVIDMLAVGMFAREASHVENKLRAAGVLLADGLEVRLHGRLEPNARFGNVRLLVDDVDART